MNPQDIVMQWANAEDGPSKFHFEEELLDYLDNNERLSIPLVNNLFTILPARLSTTLPTLNCCYQRVLNDGALFNMHIRPALERLSAHILLSTEKFDCHESIEEHLETHGMWNEPRMVFQIPRLIQENNTSIDDVDGLEQRIIFILCERLLTYIYSMNEGWGDGVPVDSDVLNYYTNFA